MQTIHIGYAIPSGEPVRIPVGHSVVTGQTQQSGKTTTLERMAHAANELGWAMVSFVTKRGEGGFRDAHRALPYFRERADWQFVASVLEATMREKLKFERPWIMRVAKGARSLSDVQRNVQTAMAKAKGMSADIYLALNEYLQIVVPQIDKLKYTKSLALRAGVNTMDLTGYSMELQALVIRSVLEAVEQTQHGTISILPEAWEFIPQNRGSPVKLAAESLIRKGGALKNYLWLDSQDIAVIHKDVLRSMQVWILGVQREANEIKRLLEHIPAGVAKPKKEDIASLERGQFYVCYGKHAIKAYVQPVWLNDDDAQAIAMGDLDVMMAPVSRSAKVIADQATSKTVWTMQDVRDAHKPVVPEPPETEPPFEDEDMAKEDIDRIEKGLATLAGAMNSMVETMRGQSLPLQPLQTGRIPDSPGGPPSAPVFHEPPAAAAVDEESMYQRFKARLAKEAPGILKIAATKPELQIEVERKTIQVDGSTVLGRLGRLVKDGFFDSPKKGYAAWQELERRGGGAAKATVYTTLDKMALDGFLTKEADGNYTVVAGMKITTKDK